MMADGMMWGFHTVFVRLALMRLALKSSIVAPPRGASSESCLQSSTLSVIPACPEFFAESRCVRVLTRGASSDSLAFVIVGVAKCDTLANLDWWGRNVRDYCCFWSCGVAILVALGLVGSRHVRLSLLLELWSREVRDPHGFGNVGAAKHELLTDGTVLDHPMYLAVLLAPESVAKGCFFAVEVAFCRIVMDRMMFREV